LSWSRTLLSPHAAWFSPGSAAAPYRRAAEAVAAVLQGPEPPDAIARPRLSCLPIAPRGYASCPSPARRPHPPPPPPPAHPQHLSSGVPPRAPVIASPLMPAAASLAKNDTTAATSAGDSTRPAG